MSLTSWAKNGWLRTHQVTKEEIRNLFEIIDRDIQDACVKGISDDWKFGTAYNAALKLCTVLLHSEGYRPEKNLTHYRTLNALPLILGAKYKDDADYLDTCRKKRNETEYDTAGNVSKEEAQELINYCRELKVEVLVWLKKHHSELLK